MHTVGRYTLLEQVGRGGAGTVFRAQSPDGTQVAVKVLHGAVADLSAQGRRFQTEVMRLSIAAEGQELSGECPVWVRVDDGSLHETGVLELPLGPGARSRLRNRIVQRPPGAPPRPGWLRRDDQDRAQLLCGIEELLLQGAVPGVVCVSGPAAFPLLTGRLSDGSPAAIAAAARFGQGRAVAFGHDLFLAGRELEQRPDAKALLAAAVHWSGAARGHAPRVGLIRARRWVAPPPPPPGEGRGDAAEDAALLRVLRAAGPEARLLAADPSAWDLARTDVVVWGVHTHLGPREQERLRAFVQGGGGLVVAVCPWGHQQLFGSAARLRDLAWNQVLAPMGLFFAADGQLDPEGERYRVASSRPLEAHAGRALEALAKGAVLAPLEATHLVRAIRAAPASDPLLLPAARAAAEGPATAPPLRRLVVEALGGRD